MTNQSDSAASPRRRFLTGAGALAGLAATSTLRATDAAEPTAETWDHEADVIVVGGGAAGCTAAVTAAQRGAKVVLIEGAVMGGTSLKSGGVIWIPNNFLMRERGIADSKHDCLQYLCRYSYPHIYNPDGPTFGLNEASYRSLEAFYDNGSRMLDFLVEIGAVRFRSFSVGSEGTLPPDYADHLPENKAPKGRAIVAVDRQGNASDGGLGSGSILISQFVDWLQDKAVPVLTGHRATKLFAVDGRVVGVEAQYGDRTVRLRARRGVIFATGGFAHNMDLAATYQTFLYGSCARTATTGDFVGMAMGAGARLANMQSAWRMQVVLEPALKNRYLKLGVFFIPGDSMLLVNKYGQRVVNEKRNYNDRTKVHFAYDPVHEDYPNQLLFMVFDDRTMDAYGGAYPLPDGPQSPYVVQGADLAELARNLTGRLAGVAHATGGATLSPDFAQRLRDTIARFNGFAESGRDLDFSRGGQAYDREWQAFFSTLRAGTRYGPNDMPNPTMHPLRDVGPYYAVILAAGALDTNGGPMIDSHAKVIGADGAPIPGLYGAGNCVASPSREAYYGAGATIGLAMTFGYIAALRATGSA